MLTLEFILQFVSQFDPLVMVTSSFASEFGRHMEQFVSQVHVDINKGPISHELSSQSELQLSTLLEE